MEPPLIDKVLLLLLTALISGLGIPWVLKLIDERKSRERARFEAQLARQTKVLEAQASLLENLSQVLWKWRYLAKKVVYYGAHDRADHYARATKEYGEAVWDLLNDFRVQISKARWLVSQDAYGRLDALYDYVVHDVDVVVTEAARSAVPNPAICQPLAHRFSAEVTQRLDDAMDQLASALHLKVLT